MPIWLSSPLTTLPDSRRLTLSARRRVSASGAQSRFVARSPFWLQRFSCGKAGSIFRPSVSCATLISCDVGGHNHTVDIYNLGVLLYDMLTGLPPSSAQDCFTELASCHILVPKVLSPRQGDPLYKHQACSSRGPCRRLHRMHHETTCSDPRAGAAVCVAHRTLLH